jgi:uncharacterized protein YecE (DUF72 family)
MMYTIGTSGYSYDDWRGVFYPENLHKGKMLDYYAEHFDCVEINSTYYVIPHSSVFYNLNLKTPKNFEFIIKLNKASTHERDDKGNSVKNLIQAVQPLIDSNKFSGFLMQFPYSFKNTPVNRTYIVETKKYTANFPLFVEFRNWTWNDENVFDMLRKNNINYVNVDQPKLSGLLEPQTEVTGELSYVRFHGRNGENWWKGTNQTRYDYLYSKAELDEWLIKLSKILKKSMKTYIFFNNHPQGKAIQNAKLLKKLLETQIDSLLK